MVSKAHKSNPRFNPNVVPNKQGAVTRIKIQESLLVLLANKPWREITIIDIARLSDISPAAVYVYHGNLDSLALATADRLDSENTELPPHLALVAALLRFELAADTLHSKES